MVDSGKGSVQFREGIHSYSEISGLRLEEDRVCKLYKSSSDCSDDWYFERAWVYCNFRQAQSSSGLLW